MPTNQLLRKRLDSSVRFWRIFRTLGGRDSSTPIPYAGIILSVILLSIPLHSGNAAEGSWSGSVDATIGPDAAMSIPLYAHKSEFVTVTVSGSIRLSESAPWSGPEGSTYYGFGPVKPPYGYTHGILMLKIDQRHLPIEGGSRALDVPCEGQVAVYVNDDGSGDNQGGFQVSVSIQSRIIGDADEDDIDDDLEDILLDAYAPEFRFDSGEDYRPTDVYWFLRNCALQNRHGADTLLDYRQAPFHPEWYLEQVTNSGQSTNYLDLASESACYAHLRPSHWYGPSWERVTAARNLGVYGHVVPTGPSEIVIEYWIFFTNNDASAPLGFGNHEGDWEFYKVFVDRNDPLNINKMKKAEWHGHGKSPCLAYWEASGGWWVLPGAEVPNRPSMPQAHPTLFIEEGTHGMWPGPVDYCETHYGYEWCASNDGQGHRYIPSSIPNIGEAYRPRLGMEVITHFNGIWGGSGDSPEGPTLKKGRWQSNPNANGNVEATYVGKWDLTMLHGSRRGRISRPWRSFADAVYNSPEDGTILIYPGSYSESVTITKRLTLKAPHGNVVIGE